MRASNRVVMLMDDEMATRMMRVTGVEGFPIIDLEQAQGTRIAKRGVASEFAEMCGDGL